MSAGMPVEVSGVRLTAADRCDRCGAQAVVITQHSNGRLMWCAHHAREHHAKLAGLKVLDKSPRLDPEPA